MTKKDYELIARSINNFTKSEVLKDYDRSTALALAGYLAKSLELDNKKFDYGRFTDIVLSK